MDVGIICVNIFEHSCLDTFSHMCHNVTYVIFVSTWFHLGHFNISIWRLIKDRLLAILRHILAKQFSIMILSFSITQLL